MYTLLILFILALFVLSAIILWCWMKLLYLFIKALFLLFWKGVMWLYVKKKPHPTQQPQAHEYTEVIVSTPLTIIQEHSEPIITPPPAEPTPAPNMPKESNDIINPNDPYNPLDITFDMIFEWEQVDNEERRLIFHRKPIVADIDFECERDYWYKDDRYYEYTQDKLIKPISIYGKRLEYYRDYSSFKDWRTKHIQVLLPEYMQGCIFKISDRIEKYGYHYIADDECLLCVYAGEKANHYRLKQQEIDEREAEERRRIALEKEKAEIAAKIKEKHRRHQLEKLVRQELIDSGELFGEQHKRPQIPREVVDAVYRRDGGRCVYCGATENLHLDHIIPFSRGGATSVENLQLLCQKCNLEKSNKIG